jgi:phosphoglycerate dehydrogenase-like enzyme|tara:strand:+ start:675 stop:1616 length:942 start_codon:yes stop_codon:yes gene_type:complete
MNKIDSVVVCSRSFSRNTILRKELLSRYANVKFNDAGLKLEGTALVEFLSGATKAITALEIIDGELLSQLPDLKIIGKYGVGTDMIDMKAMEYYGIYLGWTGGVNKRSVSEMVVSLIILMLRHLPIAQRDVIAGKWKQRVGGLLSGRTLGVVGCGFVGKDLIQILHSWDCRFLAHDLDEFDDFYKQYNVESVTLPDLLKRSDIVSLHLPLDESTQNIIDAKHLRLMKPSAILINLARGGLVDETELKYMLIENRLRAAAFDVFSTEPPKDKELLLLDNFFATPHLGGSSEEAILSMGLAAIDGLDNFSIPLGE